MTIEDLFEQAKALTPAERRALADRLLAYDTEQGGKSSTEILALLDTMDPIAFVDDHIKDPVEWVQAQRQKTEDRLKPYRDADHD